MSRREEVHQLHVQAGELVEHEAVVLERRAVDGALQVPGDGGHAGALLRRQRFPVHRVQFGQRGLGAGHFGRAVGGSIGREQAVELVLLGALEVLDARGLLGVLAHLVAGDLVGPVVEFGGGGCGSCEGKRCGKVQR